MKDIVITFTLAKPFIAFAADVLNVRNYVLIYVSGQFYNLVLQHKATRNLPPNTVFKVKVAPEYCYTVPFILMSI